jgi:hypothetical protein
MGRIRQLLRKSWIVTIFGYSSPKTDLEARNRIIKHIHPTIKDLIVLRLMIYNIITQNFTS